MKINTQNLIAFSKCIEKNDQKILLNYFKKFHNEILNQQNLFFVLNSYKFVFIINDNKIFLKRGQIVLMRPEYDPENPCIYDRYTNSFKLKIIDEIFLVIAVVTNSVIFLKNKTNFALLYSRQF